MEAKDGSVGFDFAGHYSAVEELKRIEKELDDKRKVKIYFLEKGDNVEVVETFESDDNEL